MKKTSFNSTVPRFRSVSQTSHKITEPGPGSYDTPASQNDMFRTLSAYDRSSVFKDTTVKMEDYSGIRG